MLYNKIGFIGFGLIGGSIAKVIKEKYPITESPLLPVNIPLHRLMLTVSFLMRQCFHSLHFLIAMFCFYVHLSKSMSTI